MSKKIPIVLYEDDPTEHFQYQAAEEEISEIIGSYSDGTWAMDRRVQSAMSTQSVIEDGYAEKAAARAAEYARSLPVEDLPRLVAAMQRELYAGSDVDRLIPAVGEILRRSPNCTKAHDYLHDLIIDAITYNDADDGEGLLSHCLSELEREALWDRDHLVVWLAQQGFGDDEDLAAAIRVMNRRDDEDDEPTLPPTLSPPLPVPPTSGTKRHKRRRRRRRHS